MEYYPDWLDALSGFHGPGGYWHVLKNGIGTYSRFGFAFLVMKTNTSNIIRGLEKNILMGSLFMYPHIKGCVLLPYTINPKKEKRLMYYLEWLILIAKEQIRLHL